MRQLGRSHMPPLMANSHLGLFRWRGRFMILFFQQVQVAPILLQLLKVAMNQPMKGLMRFIWPKLFFLLGGPFTLQRKRK